MCVSERDWRHERRVAGRDHRGQSRHRSPDRAVQAQVDSPVRPLRPLLARQEAAEVVSRNNEQQGFFEMFDLKQFVPKKLCLNCSSQCSTTGVTKAVVCAILSVGWCI